MASGEDSDGNGSSSPEQKKQRITSHDDEEEVADNEEEETGNQSENELTASENSPFFLILSDPTTLCCCICHDRLSVPVYQCKSSHLVCGSCYFVDFPECVACRDCDEYFCNTLKESMTLKKILESLKVPCRNMKYGCKETLEYCKRKYSMESHHEKTCIFVPCSCPHCDFIASSEQLSDHMGYKHSESITRFSYDCFFSIPMGNFGNFVVLQEEKDGDLFILFNNVKPFGNMVMVRRLGPCLTERKYFYELKADNKSCLLWVESSMTSVRNRVGNSPTSNFLVVPSGFVSPGQELNLSLRIWYTGF